MEARANEPKGRTSDTYVVERQHKEKELDRLIQQDRLFTRGMGGVLPEQEDATTFRSILDIGCGPGEWLIQAAQMYPTMTELVGVDINGHFIQYANNQAQALGLADRVSFRTMDATLMLEFSNSQRFDLVNIRLGSSFLRMWDWPKALSEMARVCSIGGTIRFTDAEMEGETTSSAIQTFTSLLMQAFYQSGHLPGATSTSLTGLLPKMIHQYTLGTGDIHARRTVLELRGGTPEGQQYYEDIKFLVSTIRPFLQKWGQLPTDYEIMTQQLLADTQEADFVIKIALHTFWTQKGRMNERLHYDTPS